MSRSDIIRFFVIILISYLMCVFSHYIGYKSGVFETRLEYLAEQKAELNTEISKGDE